MDSKPTSLDPLRSDRSQAPPRGWGLGIIASAIPAFQAMQLRIVEPFRRGG